VDRPHAEAAPDLRAEALDRRGVAEAVQRDVGARPGPTRWRPPGCDRVALVLQGGGALGAYQAGVYEALEEAGVAPDWVSAVSIGAINAALIAGNPPGRRLDRLRAFWERVSARPVWPLLPDGTTSAASTTRTARSARCCWASPASSPPTCRARGSRPAARAPPPPSTTPRHCARRCWSWWTSA
jgi:hypothetical protein